MRADNRTASLATGLVIAAVLLAAGTTGVLLAVVVAAGSVYRYAAYARWFEPADIRAAGHRS